MLYLILKAFEGGNTKKHLDCLGGSIPEEELKRILIYTAAFLENSGNYKSFGDSKFVPECSEENFVKFWVSSPYWSKNAERFDQIWKKIAKYIFSWEKPFALINFSDKEGTTGYYSCNCTSEDAEKVKKILI